MIIQHNMLAMNNLMMGKQLQKSKSKNMERLSSGYRINRAADDAANMAISEKMTSRIRALARCQNNIEEGISLAQTADGALNEVNNMLNRVNELCVQAANGTNTTEDRAKIAEEITQIYDDMDRIFETTEYNTMKIFRHDGDNYNGPEPEYLYHESVTELPPGELHNWGEAMFPTRQFDLAKPATPATATLKLKNGINLGDSSTMDGTSFFIKHNGSTYKIEFGTAQSTGSTSNGYYINTSQASYDTVPEAFNKVASNYSFIESVSVTSNQVKFTFTMPEETKQITFKTDTNADGIRETITANETVKNGAKNNGISIYCGNSLNPIEETPNAKLTYAQTATQTLTILKNKGNTDPLADDLTSFRNNLKNNYLTISPGRKIEFKDFIDTVSTAGELRREIADAINNLNDPSISASFDDSGIGIEINISGLSNSSYTTSYVTEGTSSLSEIDALDPLNPLIDNTFSVSIQTTPATGESFSKHTFQMPAFDPDKLYTLKVNDQTYVIYDYNTYKDYSRSSSPYYSDYNSASRSMEETFLYILKQEYGTSTGYTVTENAGEISLVSKQLGNNNPLVIENSVPSSFILKDMSEPALEISNQYFKQEYWVSIDFSSVENNGIIDTAALNGKGFFLNNKYYQFRDAANTYEKYNADTLWISLNSGATLADLSTAIDTAITDTKISVAGDGATGIKITGQGETSYSSSSTYVNFSDGGPTGTFSTSTVSAGGTAYKNPQTEIDFSKYDISNLNELYGTGFRLTCATCPGEFVNVMFCHDKSELTYPASFEYTDENGNTNTIHNYMVELKDVTHGSQIAANIADQLRNDLDHFTEVKVSDTNPSILIAQDKRSLNQSGRGKVMAGVYTNFLYNVDPEKLPNLGDKVGGGRKDTDAYYAYCMIYAGDTQDKPYIPVHLPHFSVENLKLEYPEEPWDTYEKITNVMNRSKNAAEVVSMARSKIGADQNRLEHAFDYAANAEEQLTDAISRIKDTDMADAVTSQAKLTILSNAQEAMLSQIVNLPEQILPLLQQ